MATLAAEYLAVYHQLVADAGQPGPRRRERSTPDPRTVARAGVGRCSRRDEFAGMT